MQDDSNKLTIQEIIVKTDSKNQRSRQDVYYKKLPKNDSANFTEGYILEHIVIADYKYSTIMELTDRKFDH